MVFLTIFRDLMKLQNFWMIKLWRGVSDVLTNEIHNLLILAYIYFFELFVNIILLYDEKGSFQAKVITLASGPL